MYYCMHYVLPTNLITHYIDERCWQNLHRSRYCDRLIAGCVFLMVSLFFGWVCSFLWRPLFLFMFFALLLSRLSLSLLFFSMICLKSDGSGCLHFFCCWWLLAMISGYGLCLLLKHCSCRCLSSWCLLLLYSICLLSEPTEEHKWYHARL
jgi:hypothetical protein